MLPYHTEAKGSDSSRFVQGVVETPASPEWPLQPALNRSRQMAVTAPSLATRFRCRFWGSVLFIFLAGNGFALAQPNLVPSVQGTGEPRTAAPGGAADNPFRDIGDPAAPAKLPSFEEAEEADIGGLPKGFVPRGETAPEFLIKEEWVYEPFGGNLTEYRRALSRWSDMKIKGVVQGEADVKAIQEIVRFRLSQFTLKEAREFREPGQKGLKPVHLLREDLIREVAQAYNNTREGPRQFHDKLLETLVQETPKLFQYHFVARINGLILLTELNQREGDMYKGIPPLPYIPAHAPLLKVLTDSKQLDALRVWAVVGLVRIAEMPEVELNGQIRYQIVAALVSELQRSAGRHYWYQFRLTEGLGLVNAFRDRDNRATISQALLQVLVDPQRPKLVRAEAAQSLGRVRLDEKVNVSLMTVEILRFAGQVGQEAETKSGQRQLLGMKLYMAFKPINAEERQRGYGLLHADKPLTSASRAKVQSGYNVLLPLIQAMLKDQPARFPAAVEKINAWVRSNQQKDSRISPEMTPIAVQEAASATGNKRVEG